VPTYLNPGVYGDGNEPGGAVNGVPTSIAAFIGFTQIGPFDTPRLVTSWSEFLATFGDFTEYSYLPHAVYGFFENEGSACYVVRVGAHSVVTATDPETALASRPVEPSDFVGSGIDGTGLGTLEALDEVSMVCAPDVMMALQQGWFDLEETLFVQRAIVADCELKRDRLAILDPPPRLDADQIRKWRSETATFDSAYATLYWPWLEAGVPSKGAHRLVPPSGHVAGIWARSDETKGVHKAPANLEVRGSIGIPINITQEQQARLNALAINCLRAFPIRGLLVWSARTLSSDSQWRYINVRRFILYLEQSIIDGTRWIASRPNDAALLTALREQVIQFLVKEWQKGALCGSSADEAFWVACDDTTSDSDGNRTGSASLDVGVAPMAPGEFVTFRITHSLQGSQFLE